MDNSYGLGELHEQLLIIMDDIDRVCRKHNIEYTISDGSLLGAIRHKGFIPWDDDMDVRMVREEYEKFIKIYEKEKSDNLIVGHPCNLVTYSVINPNYEIPGMIKSEGSIVNPWVSIFAMDYVPQNTIVSNLKAFYLRLLSGMVGKPPQYPNFSKKTRLMWDIASFLGIIIGPKLARKLYDKACVSHNEKTSDYLSSYSINSKGAHTRYPKEMFREYEDRIFENRTYRSIKQYDKYLTMVYQDYMTPIKPEKRNPIHFTEVLDSEKNR